MACPESVLILAGSRPPEPSRTAASSARAMCGYEDGTFASGCAYDYAHASFLGDGSFGCVAAVRKADGSSVVAKFAPVFHHLGLDDSERLQFMAREHHALSIGALEPDSNIVRGIRAFVHRDLAREKVDKSTLSRSANAVREAIFYRCISLADILGST